MKIRPRIEVVYMALQQLRSREIMRKVGTGDYLQRGEDNSLLMELAKVIDNELQAEVERRKAPGGGAPG